jgi:mannitol/fructose-specific phosphotransferase system IIA component (Ntr-type)
VAEESFAREEPLGAADSVALGAGTVARVESKPMISADQVLVWEGRIEKEDALRALLKLCCRSEPKVIEEIAWEKLMARERQGSTFVGEGVAIPHARIDELDRPVIALGVPRTGISDAETRTTIQIMILLLTPTSDANAHVKVLGEVTRMVQESQWRKGVVEARSAQEIGRILSEWQGLWTPPTR